MFDLFTRDIEQGIQGTDVKAAFLKCAIDHHGLTGGVERIMRACAKTHLGTGAPMMVHTHPGSQTALEVQRVLAEEGVAPDRGMLAHSGDSTDADHLAGLAGEGVRVGWDGRLRGGPLRDTHARVDRGGDPLRSRKGVTVDLDRVDVRHATGQLGREILLRGRDVARDRRRIGERVADCVAKL